MCLSIYVLNSVWCCPLHVTISHKNDVRFVFASSCVWGLMLYLHYLCLFAYRGVQRILFCVWVFFFVLCTICCQFLWIVHFMIGPSVFSNVYFIIIITQIYTLVCAKRFWSKHHKVCSYSKDWKVKSLKGI